MNALQLNVEFHLSKPWTVLFAPSGAGKTTVLRTIAGLIQADYARIAWTREVRSSGSPSGLCVLADTESNRFTPAHARCLPMLTQDSALFPHLTVAKNVGYGFQGRSGLRGDAQSRQRLLCTLLELCRIEHLIDKMPAQLSGGERQRVALARALGANASGVLLDEPFVGLDGTLKDTLMQDVKIWLGRQDVPVLHVTHDVGEVFAVADEVIVLGGGRVVGQGPPELILREERKRLLKSLGP